MATSPWNLPTGKGFFPLLLTQCCNAFIILLTYGMLQTTSSSHWLIVLAVATFIIPFGITSLVAGQMVDRFTSTTVAGTTSLLQLGAVILAAIGLLSHSEILLLIAILVLGIHAAFFSPYKYSILVTQFTEQDSLIKANAYIQVALFFAAVVGILISTQFTSSQSGHQIIAMLSLAMSGIALISSFFIPVTPQKHALAGITFNPTLEAKKLIPTLLEQKTLFIIIFGISWFWLISSALLTLLPSFTQHILENHRHLVSFLLSIFAAGIALGACLYLRVISTNKAIIFVPITMLINSFLLLDLFFINPAATTTTSLIADIHTSLAILLLGITNGIYIVPLYAALQSVGIQALGARSIASNNIINALFIMLTAAITGLFLTLRISSSVIFLIISLLSIITAIYLCKLLPDATLKAGICWFFKKFYKSQVMGLENYYQTKNSTLLIANQASFIDVLIISAFLPDRMIFATHSAAIKKWWQKPLLILVDVFIIDSTHPIVIKTLVEQIRAGRRCLIFPQNHLNIPGGAPMKIYEGPGMIADKAEADILPIIVEGSQHTSFSRLKDKVRLKWFPPITLKILPPKKLEINAAAKGRNRRQLISNKLYELTTDLAFESSNYHTTLFKSLIEACQIHGGNYKIIEDVERKPVTYRQMLGRAFIIGRYIAKHSSPNEYIGILLPNMVGTVICFFATYTFGRLPAMLNFSAGAKNILSACQTAKTRIVLTSRRFIEAGNLNNVAEKLTENGIQVVYLEEVRKNINTFDKLIGLFMGYFPNYFYRKNNPHATATDPAVVLFTSGSEGTPKGVILSHENIQANRLQLTARVDFGTRDIAFNVLPIFHSFGLTGGTILPILSGTRAFFYPSPLHYRIIPELIYDTSATIMFGTDTFLTGYARAARPYDFYSIRYVFAGAEKLKDETRKIWSEKFSVRIFEGYGVTETAPVLATNTPMQNKIGTVGKLLPQINYKLESIPGILEGGRLYINGPNVMVGYMFAEQPGKVIPPNAGWHDTGDIVAIDEEGFITIKGRAKRFAKIGGEMISLGAVEEWLQKLWPETQNIVVNIADPRKGEQIILVTENQQATREAIIAYFKEQGISEIHIPKKILHIAQIHVLGTGKVDYVGVKEWVEQQVGKEDE